MKAFLGVDGGGTKTAFILCDEAGTILGRARLSTSNYLQAGFEGVTAVFEAGIHEVCRQAKLCRCDIVRAFVGTTGYGDTKANDPLIRDAIGRAMGPIPHRVENDSENALAGALAGNIGICLIGGTGAIACGRNRRGEVLRCGGWHHYLGGDEGSAYWISLQILHAFTRQSDGRSPRTILYDTVVRELGLEDDGDLVVKVVETWNMDRIKIASLSRLAGELHDKGDPEARAIILRAAGELSDLAVALKTRLGLENGTPVSYTGGVFNLGMPLLDPLLKRLAGNGLDLRTPVFGADRGALILAFQDAGIPVPPSLRR